MELPFQAMVKNETRYKVFGIVTNMGWEGPDLAGGFGVGLIP